MTNRSFLWIKSTVAFSSLAFLVNLSFTSANYTDQTRQEKISSENTREAVVDFRRVAKEAIPAVVSIKVQTKKRPSYFGGDSDDAFDIFGDSFWQFFNIPKESRSKPFTGQASGVIVSADGYILTNSHVVNEMDNILVQLNDGREFNAKVLGQDTNSDLALIKIDAQNLPFLKLSNSNDLEIGQWVVAVGNPFGLQASVTSGIVSAKGRNNLDIVRYEDFIQTDASINSGNSGGPLVNLDGEIVGINTAIATNSSSGYIGIGFAIPSNMARYVMNEILTNGKVSRGFIGVALQSIDYNLAQAFDLKKVEGALVTNVVKGSPADKAGIKTEDIILKYDGHPVDNAASLRNNIYMIHPGTKLTLTVLREGKIIEVPLQVGQFDEEQKTEKITTPQRNALGVEVDNLTPELADSLGYSNEHGVVVTKVQSNSPAALAGIKKGALILSINRQKIENKEQFYEALKNNTKGRPTLFQIKQGDVNAFLSIRID